MSETKRSTVCIDANLVVNALTPGPYSIQAINLIDLWGRQQITLLAPSLLGFEVTSALRRMVYQKVIYPEHGESAFTAFRQLAIRYSSRGEIFRQAWRLAKELDRPRAYDTAYLAVARLYQCDFWTADERLFNVAHPVYPWVRWITEAS